MTKTIAWNALKLVLALVLLAIWLGLCSMAFDGDEPPGARIGASFGALLILIISYGWQAQDHHKATQQRLAALEAQLTQIAAQGSTRIDPKE